MKDRLTKRKGNHVYINTETIPRKNCPGDYGFKFCSKGEICENIENRKCPVLMVLDRLAEYEDNAERTIILPCEIGDTVYMPWQYNGVNGIAILTVTQIIIDYGGGYIKTDFETDDEEYYELYNGGRFNFNDFGKIVFLTKDEIKKRNVERGNK